MAPRVVVIGLASDFGCQVQMTNMEDDLLDVLGLIDLSYWQLAASGHMPEEYDVAVIEGAVTTGEHIEALKRVRDTASTVIAIGACAITGGIPSLAGIGDLEERYATVYGEGPGVARGRVQPVGVTSVIDVDYVVPGCPIDPYEFVSVLARALQGLSGKTPGEPMCASCKTKENVCFYENGKVCLGVITRAGCGARCVTLGRPCLGCRGLSTEANFSAAAKVLHDHGVELDDVLATYRLYNATEEATFS